MNDFYVYKKNRVNFNACYMRMLVRRWKLEDGSSITSHSGLPTSDFGLPIN